MIRMIDANINRICEGLRVIEDFVRFELDPDNKKISVYMLRLKYIRHFLREKIKFKELLFSRNSIRDPGKKLSRIESNRSSMSDLLKANFYRIEEGLRSLEESFKLNAGFKKHIGNIKSFRFEIYEMEKNILIFMENCRFNFENHLTIDTSSVDKIEIEKIFNFFIRNKMSSLQLERGSDNNKKFYEKTLAFNSLCRKKNISLIIKNNIEIALAINESTLVIDENNIPIKILRNVFPKATGLITNKIYFIDDKLIENFNYILIDKILSEKEKKILKKYSRAIKIGSKYKTEKLEKINGKIEYSIYREIP